MNEIPVFVLIFVDYTAIPKRELRYESHCTGGQAGTDPYARVDRKKPSILSTFVRKRGLA